MLCLFFYLVSCSIDVFIVSNSIRLMFMGYVELLSLESLYYPGLSFESLWRWLLLGRALFDFGR